MEYKKITDIKEPVSRIVFGTAVKPMLCGENVFELLDTVFRAGINTFDLARCYGMAEQVQDPWGGGCLGISGEKHRRERDWYLKEGITIFAYAGLAHGFLSGKFESGDSRRFCIYSRADAFEYTGIGHQIDRERTRVAE